MISTLGRVTPLATVHAWELRSAEEVNNLCAGSVATLLRAQGRPEPRQVVCRTEQSAGQPFVRRILRRHLTNLTSAAHALQLALGGHGHCAAGRFMVMPVTLTTALLPCRSRMRLKLWGHTVEE